MNQSDRLRYVKEYQSHPLRRDYERNKDLVIKFSIDNCFWLGKYIFRLGILCIFNSVEEKYNREA